MSGYRRLGATGSDELQNCFNLNRAFRGWGHQFLYNERTLRTSLLDAGYAAMANAIDLNLFTP